MAEERQQSMAGPNEGNGRNLDLEQAVQQRYGGAAHQAEVGLCVPVQYDTSLSIPLKSIFFYQGRK